MLGVDRLKHLLEYDPGTGVFVWLQDRGVRRFKGKSAGAFDKKGYLHIKIDGKSHCAHRLAWFYMTRVWPEGQIDHRDRNPGNNRWENLRCATRSQNCANSTFSASNKLGVKGVHRRGARFIAQIYADGKKFHLGMFNTVQEASAAYAAAADKHHGEFARAA